MQYDATQLNNEENSRQCNCLTVVYKAPLNSFGRRLTFTVTTETNLLNGPMTLNCGFDCHEGGGDYDKIFILREQFLLNLQLRPPVLP